MRLSSALAILLFGMLPVRAQAGLERTAEDREAFFESRIRPVLARTCFRCHGGQKSENNLRLDRREALLKGGDSGPAVVPGDPDKSLLIRALRYRDDELRMPPDKRLPDRVIADFESWVRAGAAWPRAAERVSSFSPADKAPAKKPHWAFEPVRAVNPPHDASDWSANGVDCFIHEGLQSHNLRPGMEASKRALLRRAYFDLIGLPPKPERVAAFLADRAPDAFSNV